MGALGMRAAGVDHSPEPLGKLAHPDGKPPSLWIHSVSLSSTSGMILGAEFAVIPMSDGVPPKVGMPMPTASGGASSSR